MEPFRHTLRVRYSEVDPQGVVFNSRYLEYADILVTEFYRERRAHGFPADIDFHVRHAAIDYRAPLRNDELVEGRLTIERIGATSLTKRIALYGEDGALRAEMTLVSVHVDLATGRPRTVPDSVRQAFGFPLAAGVSA